jgi:hypothetical protein
VMGPTQDREPPVRVCDPVAPSDEYARSKVQAEAEAFRSGLRACVLRLAAVMPTEPSFSVRQAAAGFDLPLGARCEAVADVDVATACIRAAETLVSESAPRVAGSYDAVDCRVRGRVFFVGGGRSGGWQMRVREMYEAVFEPAGLTLPAEQLFTSDPNRFAVDWYDTDDTQRHFHFQNHTLSDYRQIVSRKYRWIRPFVALANPLVRWYLGRLSPYGPRGPTPSLRRKRTPSQSEA